MLIQKTKIYIINAIIVFLVIFYAKEATAQQFKYTVTDGLWNTDTVWNDGTIPNNGDTIIIQNNITYNVSENFTASLLEIGPGTTLTLNDSTLIVNNLFLSGGTLANSAYNLTISDGALICIYDSGSIAITPLGTSYDLEYNNALPINTGPELQNNSVIRDLIINSTDNVTLNSNVTVNRNFIILGGNLNIGSRTLTLNGGIQSGVFFGTLTGGATSKITFGGSGSVTLPNIVSGQLKALKINRTLNDSITLGGNLNIKDTLNINGGTLANNVHNITMSAGALICMQDSSRISITPIGTSYDLKYNNTLPINTGPELQNNSVIRDLIINSIDSVTLTSNATVNRNFITFGGNLNIGSFTLTLNGGIQTGINFGSLTGGDSSKIIIGGTGISSTLPAVKVNNLTLNRANGISLGGNVMISGILSIINGKIALDTNNLILGSSAVITGISDSTYIITNGTGVLIQNISNNNTYVTFPVGPTSTSYNPVNIKLDLTSTPDEFGVRVSNTITNPPNKPLEVIQKEWIIMEETPGGSNATIQYSFASEDFGSGFNPNLIPNVYDIGHYSSGYEVLSGSISVPINNLYSITNTHTISNFSTFIVGNYNSVTGANVLNFALTTILSGNYDGATMVPKNVLVELHNSTAPYAMVDSQTVLLNTSGIGTPVFTKGVNETPYYIVLKFDNGLETWSETAQTFTSSALNYDFTTADTQAFGSNMLLVGTKWCIISGDVNQDASVDALDRSVCWNDRNLTGIYATDLNGDGVVDALDRSICWNNRNLSVQKPALVLTSNSAVNQNNKGTNGNTTNGKTKSTYDLKLDGSNKKKIVKQNHYLK